MFGLSNAKLPVLIGLGVISIVVFVFQLFAFSTPLKNTLWRRIDFVSPTFRPHPALAHLHCPAYFDAKSPEHKTYKQITIEDPANLSMSCVDIRRRNTFMTKTYPEEEGFPLAVVRAVYKDYTFHEQELAANYNPNNVYCYVLDKKADMVFKSRIRSLGKCFDNVIVDEKEFNMTSFGFNVVVAQFSCLKLLLKRKWKHVLVLENYDILAKTNQELVEIFKIVNGTNLVGTFPPKKMLPRARVDFALKNSWRLGELGIIKGLPKSLRNTSLTISKSLPQVSLSYEAVHHLINVLNTTTILHRMNGDFYEHELLQSTLNSNEILKVPGGYTTRCLNDLIVNDITRFTIWQDAKCPSNQFRHYICLMVMKDLPNLAKIPELIINKMLMGTDFGAIGCWHEYMFNNQHIHRKPRIDRKVYLNLAQVRWNQLKSKGRSAEFKCT